MTQARCPAEGPQRRQEAGRRGGGLPRRGLPGRGRLGRRPGAACQQGTLARQGRGVHRRPEPCPGVHSRRALGGVSCDAGVVPCQHVSLCQEGHIGWASSCSPPLVPARQTAAERRLVRRVQLCCISRLLTMAPVWPIAGALGSCLCMPSLCTKHAVLIMATLEPPFCKVSEHVLLSLAA